jgi:hypothetical protein
MSLIDSASLILTPNAYKEGKLYSVIPSDGSGDFTFTRATTATRVNSDGLVELVPYNLLSYSEQFDNAYWTKRGSTITANVTTAPDGQTTADELKDDTSSFLHDLFFEPTGYAENSYFTLSAFVKANTISACRLIASQTGNVNYAFASFNLSTKATTATLSGTFTNPTSKIDTFPNGWLRVSLTFQTGSGGALTWSSSGCSIRLEKPYQTQIYTGTGQSLYVWGAQLVEGSNALPYQKTETRLNIPRIDYSLGGCPNILLEPQRTNVWLNSDDFNAGTISSNLITYTANTTETTAPNGTNTADKFEVTTSGGDARRRFTRTIAIQNFSLSLYVKGAAGQKFQLFLARDSFAELKDINTTLNGEWQRIVLNDSFSTTSSTVVMGVEFGFTSDDSVAGQIYYLWGAQLEAGSYATSYIPTTTASVTRNQDVCVKTGISSLIGQTEGTIFFDANFDDSDTVNFSISDGTSSNYVLIDTTSARSVFARVQQGGVTQAQISTTSSFYSVGERLKCAIAYKSNDFAFYINGTSIGTDNSGSVPTLDQLRFSRWNGALAATQRINQTILFPTRLTNDQLEQLTTI